MFRDEDSAPSEESASAAGAASDETPQLNYTRLIFNRVSSSVPFTKNIWLIYKLFLFLGLGYLVATAYTRWDEIESGSAVELAYLNRVFSSSVTLNFDQQEIMLDLLGRQILNDESPDRWQRAQSLLDSVLRQNESLLAFGLANLDGDIIVGSSNLDLSKMPNLKRFENSRKTFLKALEADRMVLGRTYFLPALDDLVIPIRKGIRDPENHLIGMMTGGIKPRELMPELDAMNPDMPADAPYQLRLFHDEDFYYAYISGIADKTALRAMIDEPIPAVSISMIEDALRQQHGTTLGTEVCRVLAEDLTPLLPEIKCPTLLLASSQDNITPMEMQRLMLERMPRATLDVFDNVGHNLKVEIPERLARRTLEFIDGVEAG